MSDLAGFRPALTGGVTARFGAAQASIVRSLVSQIIELVADEDEPERTGTQPAQDDLAAQLGLSDNAELPADPILARLLPDAYADDPDASAEFRRYTEISLRSGKVAAAQTVLATLPRIRGRGPADDAGRAGLAAGAERRAAGAGGRARGHRRLRRPDGRTCPRTTRAPPTSGSTSGWATSRRAWCEALS